MLMNMRDEERQVQGNARERPRHRQLLPPAQSGGPAVLRRMPKKGYKKSCSISRIRSSRRQSRGRGRQRHSHLRQ